VLRPNTRPRQAKRYTRPVPGDRVQFDTCKIGPGLYQFTAVDDCTRLRVLGLYPSRTAQDAVHFLRHRLLSEMPFPIQRIQSDRGSEFIGFDFQEALKAQCIKFRPNRPRAPHLNGKVERSQRTDRAKFWSTVDRKEPQDRLEAHLSQWQVFYNQERTHSAIGSKTPLQRLEEKRAVIPSREAVPAAYDPAKEELITNSYGVWVPFEKLTPKAVLIGLEGFASGRGRGCPAAQQRVAARAQAGFASGRGRGCPYPVKGACPCRVNRHSHKGRDKPLPLPPSTSSRTALKNKDASREGILLCNPHINSRDKPS
jgi:hypothetical protein